MTWILEATGLRRRFTVGESVHVDALRGVDLRVATGEWLAITGPSGSGKTSLLNVLGLLDGRFEGELALNGAPTHGLTEPSRARARLTQIGFVFQAFHLIPWLSAEDNVAVPHWHLTGDRRASLERAREALTSVGLGDRAAGPVSRLSGGQQQRVAIARAIVNLPALVLADEPTGNLDSATATGVLDLLAGLVAGGLTLVTVTHDPAVVGRATRAITLQDGLVVSSAPP
jgi:putative ABC transport system ATP-binding protein